MRRFVIFTDLDATLLDYSTYSFEGALPALRRVREEKIPLVICSSKTRKEIEYYRKKLGNGDPFISENGGGIFVPKSYFHFEPRCDECSLQEEQGYFVMGLGARYADLRKALETLRVEGFAVTGFGDMTVTEVARLAGTTIPVARMAKERDFDEPFVFEGGKEETRRLFDAITAAGFRHARGRFFHILGNSDKGKAVSILSGFYKRKYGEVETIALGDSPLDLPMLEQVDHPVAVGKPDGSYDPHLSEIPKLVRAEGIGPRGWNTAVLRLLQR
ncbi:MAG: HAD-IIB family hydrolase [Nitrospirae bacterium]|nr:HAD-IIB family hydrolase [Nitrospirota bacterium]